MLLIMVSFLFISINVILLFLIEYFGPSNDTDISVSELYNTSILQERTIAVKSRLWLPLQERLKRSNSSRKTRLWIEKPANNRRW